MSFILDPDIASISMVKNASFDTVRFNAIYNKSLNNIPLHRDDILFLIAMESEQANKELLCAANRVKEQYHGKNVRLFAPLYLSNECENNCIYCGFRKGNTSAERETLSVKEVMQEAALLSEQGHRNILLVTAENHEKVTPEFICNIIAEIKNQFPLITAVNLNYPPVKKEDFELFADSRMDTFQSFQETYHHETYIEMHPEGDKSDYAYRLSTFDRACSSGIKELGVGLLWGLYDYRYELVSMIEHLNYLDQYYGIIPGTISVPRLRPAENSMIQDDYPYLVDDDAFCKIIAISRLAFPRWQIAVSTRENAQMRLKNLSGGASMLSAGSTTNPGGYSRKKHATKQFEMDDARPLSDVINDICKLGMVPQLEREHIDSSSHELTSKKINH